MARGRKPEPAAIKRAKGNPGQRRIGADPAAPAAARQVKRPVWLDAKARSVWDRLAPMLSPLKLLTPTDAETFGRYCCLFSEWLICMRAIAKEGRTYEIVTASGTVRRLHPLIAYSLRLNRELVVGEANFGLNPAERQRIFALRAGGKTGDLFSDHSPTHSGPAPSPSKTPPARSPVGMLN